MVKVDPAFELTLPFELERYDGGGEDELGNEMEYWGAPEELLAFAAEPPVSTEPELAGHDRVIVDMNLYAPIDVGIGPKDRVVLAGNRFEVVGHPQDPNMNPWWPPGLCTVKLRRVEG